MPYIKVDVGKISNFQQEIATIRSRMSVIYNSFSMLNRMLDSDVKNSNDIRRKMSNIETDLSSQNNALNKTYTFLGTAYSKYSAVDSTVKTKSSVLSVGSSVKHVSQTPETVTTAKVNEKPSWGETLKKIADGFASSLNPITGILGGVGGIIKGAKEFGSDAIKGVLDMTKGIAKIGKNVAKVADAVKIYSRTIQEAVANAQLTKRLINTLPELYRNASKAGTFGKRFVTNLKKEFADALDDFNIGSATKKGGTKVFGKVMNIIGTVADVGINIYENYQEHTDSNGNTNWGSFIYESVAESAIDIAFDVGVGVVVGAAVAALGGPAIIAAGATALITIGADALLEHFTGKDLSEHLVDFGAAVAKGAKEVVSNTVQKVTEVAQQAQKVVTNVANTVVDAGKAVVKTATQVVSQATTAVSNAAKSVGNAISSGAKSIVSGIGKGLKSLFGR